MREIEFRGRSVVTGEWLYGSLIQAIPQGAVVIYDDNQVIHEVDSETVGQFTGVKDDKNGNKIFEKDIVHTVGVIPGVTVDDIGIVKFIDGSYIVESMNGNDGWELFQEGAEIEIIGNTSDNSELLEVER
ncbi:YopX family protein [Bacillus sp. FJAT-52991]|uniref:YopX family protein n=1 Tax=Bacillus kandeliae TaxID=3129297 RepID=A0ABZ2NAB2_9BACI